MYSNFFLFYSSIFCGEARGGEREGWLQPKHAIDFMTPKLGQEANRTEFEQLASPHTHCTWTFTQTQPSEEIIQARRGESSMSPMQRNQGGQASETPLVSKIRSSRTSQGIFSISGGGENQRNRRQQWMTALHLQGCFEDLNMSAEERESVKRKWWNVPESDMYGYRWTKWSSHGDGRC